MLRAFRHFSPWCHIMVLIVFPCGGRDLCRHKLHQCDGAWIKTTAAPCMLNPAELSGLGLCHMTYFSSQTTILVLNKDTYTAEKIPLKVGLLYFSYLKITLARQRQKIEFFGLQTLCCQIIVFAYRLAVPCSVHWKERAHLPASVSVCPCGWNRRSQRGVDSCKREEENWQIFFNFYLCFRMFPSYNFRGTPLSFSLRFPLFPPHQRGLYFDFIILSCANVRISGHVSQDCKAL